MSLKCSTQYVSKFGKLSSGHKTGKGQFSFQFQRRAMPKNIQTIAQLHSSHMLARRRKWQLTPVFLPGESHGQRILVGYKPWGHKELDMTERLNWTELNTVKGFGVIKAKVDFLKFCCFFYDPTDIGNLISVSSAFLKSNLNIWKFLFHVLLKPRLENFEHYFASMWNEWDCR